MTAAQDTRRPDGRPTRTALGRALALGALGALALPLGAQQGARPAPPAAPPPADTMASAPTGAPVAPATAAGRALRPANVKASLRAAPDGRVIGTLDRQGTVVPLARERGWVRVRLDAWVRERDLLPVDSALSLDLSAADLRADPDAARGKVVRWDVEVLAFQRADALRRDLQLGEPYLLARGPVGENALLYLALPASLVDEGRALPPLTVMRVTARVRTGRAAPTNVPILDVETLARP